MYHEINETAARRAHEANSFREFKPGRATSDYRSQVDAATALAERQKQSVDPMFEDQDRQAELRELAQERYRANQDKIEDAMAAGLPVLDFGGFDACWNCQTADHDTQTGEDDDLCTVICKNPDCPEQRKGR